ncbi:hypothetical protein AGMMS50284_0690 [Clostridia bacterium]|nr:hypothetical protein AGMMS50284_0690 [Clostridia bacterium]
MNLQYGKVRIIRNLVIIPITILSAILLVLVFFFSDTLFSVKNSKDSLLASIDLDPDINVTINFTDNTITYDGTGNFDAMKGVTATDENGNDVTKLVTASIAEEKPSDTKATITYSISTPGYEFASASRTLELRNYKKPKITLKNSDLACDIIDLDELIQKLAAEGTLRATDGFGHDISEGIYCEDFTSITSSGEYTVTFSIMNFLNDKATVDATLVIKGELPSSEPITLTSNPVYIKKGSDFEPLDYVETAYDKDGNNMIAFVKVQGNVHTSNTGEYTITYYLDDGNEPSKSAVKLTVIVTDDKYD